MDRLPAPLAFLFLLFSGWINRQQQDVIEYLLEDGDGHLYDRVEAQSHASTRSIRDTDRFETAITCIERWSILPPLLP